MAPMVVQDIWSWYFTVTNSFAVVASFWMWLIGLFLRYWLRVFLIPSMVKCRLFNLPVTEPSRRCGHRFSKGQFTYLGWRVSQKRLVSLKHKLWPVIPAQWTKIRSTELPENGRFNAVLPDRCRNDICRRHATNVSALFAPCYFETRHFIDGLSPSRHWMLDAEQIGFWFIGYWKEHPKNWVLFITAFHFRSRVASGRILVMR